ncbi:MAG: hypothetical protein KBT36_04055 [Kurthia sp.]|nr:hypothetical protein [Candidatus Kurthia equi]
MNWRKILTTILIIATVILFVVTVRQHDKTVDLQQQLGVQYSQKVQNFRNYVQDIQSANDTGDSISTNHYYSEINSFPIANKELNLQMNEIYDELDKIADGKSISSENRRKLSEDLNKLQLTLNEIIKFSENDSMTWYQMVNDEDSKVQQKITNHYK